MKKFFIIFGFFVFTVCASAQTFVSTAPSKRNALIEEYTGVNCQYCPLGHKSTDQTVAAFPGRVFAINIHQGTFASQYTTQWGNALASQANISGYPSSTMNRHAFSGTSIQMNPGESYMRALQVLDMDAPVNVAATVDIDPVTRLVVVKVEAYYTATSNADFNLLNIALIQNNVLGSQVGGSTWYPENMIGGQYIHKHILRDLLTGQWGDTIHNTTAGSFFTKEYAYVLPYSIGGLNINNLEDLSFLVFVCENHKEVLNACEAMRVGDKAYLSYNGSGAEECALTWHPYVTVVNPTDKTINNLRFTVDGNTIVRNKSIAPYHTDTVRVATFGVDQMPADHQNYARTSSVNFTGYSADGATVNLTGEVQEVVYGDVNIYTAEGPLTLTVHYDNYPTEVSYSLAGMGDCLYYYQGGGANSDIGNTATAGLYRLKIFDVGGDGLDGTITVKDAQGNTLFSRNGSDLMVWDNEYFNITNDGTDGPIGPVPTNVEEREDVSGNWIVWPNPVNDVLHIDGEYALMHADLLDISGRLVSTTTNHSISVSNLPAGLYVLRIVWENGLFTKKIIKQ